MLAISAAAIVLTVYGYRRTTRQLPRSPARTLLALRLGAVLLVLLLLFRPVLSLQRDVQQKRALILVLDQSASMSIRDDASGVPRFDQARSRVLEWTTRLNQEFELPILTFADQATTLEDLRELQSLTAEGKATSLTRGLVNAARVKPRAEVEGVVLFSDGNHNAAGDPVEIARKLGVVVHTVGVGNSLHGNSSYRDIQVTGLECPPQLPINNQARLTAFVDAVGFPGRVVKVQLEEDERRIAEADLVLDDVEGPQAVALQFLPTVKGRHRYTVRVPVLSEEKIAENNHRSALAQVVDARLRVLYLEGTLRAEYGALVDRFLAKDADIEFCALVQTRRNVFLQRTNIAGLKLSGIPTDPAVLARFDVFVIGDLDSTFLRPEQMNQLIKRVREGAGLVMIGGYNSLGPGGYGGTPLEAILPVEVGSREIGQVKEAFLPVLTPEGRTHPIFANIAGFFPTREGPAKIAGLPPLDGCVRLGRARPSATVLAVLPDPGGTPQAAMPILAIHPVGQGRAAVFTGDTTRNWQQIPRAFDKESPFLRFWGQLIRWAANRNDAVKAEAGIEAHTDRAYYEPDSPVTILAVVRDKDGEGAGKAEVRARVRVPQSHDIAVNLTPVAGPAGHYRGIFDPHRSGTYEIVVEGKLGSETLKAESITVEVGRPNLEFERVDLDEKMLTRIAAATGGRYYHLSTADRLLETLDRKEQKRRLALEQPLYWPPLYWILFVGLLTGEWLLRRRYQLR